MRFPGRPLGVSTPLFSTTTLLGTILMAVVAGLLSGCETTNNNLQVTTATGKFLSGGKTAVAPMKNQPVSGYWESDMPKGDPNNTVFVNPFGSVYNFSATTNPSYIVSNARMPAYWHFTWDMSNDACINPNYPYGAETQRNLDEQIVLPTSYFWPGQQILDGVTGQYPGPVLNLVCWTNSPLNPDFVSSDVSPQFALDNAFPLTIRVNAFKTIAAVPSSTQLNVYNMSLGNPATITAQSVASDGSSATFPYPHGLPAGSYLATITTGSGSSLTTNGLEPFFLAHNDTSWTSAFGVDVATPTETVQTLQWQANQYTQCAGETTTTTTYGGSTLPLVTLTTQGKLAVGSAGSTITVGTNPTVVLAYNYGGRTNQVNGSCGPLSITTYSGAQSALVVNTGSNNVSLVNIGQYSYPSGTVAVGTTPVAAAINPGGTYAYIANYGSGTISEISLTNVNVTRTLSVGANPTSVAFDSAGNLWVGIRGALEEVNLSNWTIAASYPVDGTITGMQYDSAQSGFVSVLLKNGSATNPINGVTANAQIAFSGSNNVSYSTTGLLSTSNGSANVMSVTGDNSAYTSSPLASRLAFPAQTAFNPPIYTASNSSTSSDYLASANGNTFTVSLLSSGKLLLSGSTPYPIRGVKLTSTTLYLTMPESNSLVTLPIQLP